VNLPMRVGIIGSSDSIAINEQLDIAFNLGKKLIDQGHTIYNGGMGGIMETSAKGARQSNNYKDNSVIAILRVSDVSLGNNYSSIKIATDMGTARNRLIILNSDAIIAIGGGAGTLNEITLAWEFGKPMAAFKNYGGWASKVAETAIDDRRNDRIVPLNSVEDAILWLNSL